MPDRALARKRLDERLHDVDVPPRPASGWIRAIREALGMSTRELADRLDISHQGLAQIERTERDGVVQVDTLRRVAHALGCRVEYVLVPEAPLEEMVRSRAREKARQMLEPTTRSMHLERQGVPDDRVEDHVDDLADDIIDKRGLWTDP